MNSTNTFLEARPRFAFPSAWRRDTPHPRLFWAMSSESLEKQEVEFARCERVRKSRKRRGIRMDLGGAGKRFWTCIPSLFARGEAHRNFHRSEAQGQRQGDPARANSLPNFEDQG